MNPTLVKFRTGFWKFLMGNLRIWRVIYLKVRDKSRREDQNSTQTLIPQVTLPTSCKNTRILRQIHDTKMSPQISNLMIDGSIKSHIFAEQVNILKMKSD